MKKKILSIALALVMVFAFAAVMTGCGDDDPVEAFNKATENMNKADDVTYDGTVKLSIEADGQSMDMKGDLDATMIDFAAGDPAKIQMYMKMNMEVMGQKMQMTMYMKDGMTYSDDGQGTRTKTKVTKENVESITKLFASDQKIDDYVKEAKTDGDAVVLTIDSKKYLADFVAKIGNLGGEGNAAVDVEQIKKSLDQVNLDDMTITATIKDENFTSLKTKIPLEIDMSAFAAMMGGSTTGNDAASQKFKMNIDLDLSSIKVNSGAKIDFPDFSDYK